MKKKLPYLIALSAFAVCLPSVSQAQMKPFVRGVKHIASGGSAGNLRFQNVNNLPTKLGLKLQVERAIAEQKTYTWGRRLYQRTPQEAAQLALKTAIYRNENDLIKPLLANGADINFPLWGTTILTDAVEHGNFSVVKTILQNGADINRPSLGEPPLITAIRHGEYDIVKFLLDNGADVNLQGKRGETALILALDEYNLDMTKLLLERGADPYIANENGYDAFWMAEHRTRLTEEGRNYFVELVNSYKK